MFAAAAQDHQFIELYDVTPESAEILAAQFGIALPWNGLEPLVIPASRRGVAWKDYESFLAATNERLLRHSYSDGTLELVSPRVSERENTKAVLRRFIHTLTLATKQPVVTLGATTIASASKGLGIEPDEAFCFARRMAKESRPYLDADCAAPPHLVIEVDQLQQGEIRARVSAIDVDRVDLLARLGVDEVWLVDRGRVQILQNKDQRLIAADHSRFLASVNGPMLTRHLRSRHRIGENAAIEQFVQQALHS